MKQSYSDSVQSEASLESLQNGLLQEILPAHRITLHSDSLKILFLWDK